MTPSRIREWTETVAAELSDYYGEIIGTGIIESATRSLLAEARREVLEEAAKVCEKRSEVRYHERGSYDSSTNAWEPHRLDADKIEEADDCASAIRQLAEREGEA